MSSNSPVDASGRPRLHPARSFTRLEPSHTESPLSRGRSKTLQTSSIPEHAAPMSPVTSPDVFEKTDPLGALSEQDGHASEEASFLTRSVHSEATELPVELASLTDRFVNSLSSKVHSSPPTIEGISSLFQDFYVRAESHIGTHISALALRINRDPSPHFASESGQPTSGHQTSRVVSSRQMLTATEVAERKKARRLLTQKRFALEEAVERRACESVYDKIWRHKSTLDEMRDDKLRSKTAALSVVGINLKDLGVDLDLSAVDDEKQKQAADCLEAARESILRMDDEKYPLGKLQHLAATHKSIVDALTNLLPSSSSADEILPTLIYTLITCPPASINVISNLLFIQRFRAANKIDGETAYCLTNLEAAISFLENVDLSSLRADETPEGSTRAQSGPPTPATERTDTLRLPRDTASPSLSSASASPEFLRPSEAPTSTLPRLPNTSASQQRRLSNLFQPPARVLGAANDAVRNTADQGLKNIGATLDSSFNFLFGRLKELQINQGPDHEPSSPVLPKTLAEARRLITLPATRDDPDLVPNDSSVVDRTNARPAALRVEDRLMELMGGSRAPRDRSTDSGRSQTSVTRKPSAVGISAKSDAQGSQPSLPNPGPSTPPSAPSSLLPTPLESMRNFGNTFNPLNHIPGMIRNFGRSAAEVSPAAAGTGGAVAVATPTSASASPTPGTEKDRSKPQVRPSDYFTSPSSSGGGDASATRIAPPIQRFIDMQDASELRLGDVALLLDDYKRLAAALGK